MRNERDELLPELPPHDEFLERSVLGAILTQPDRPHSWAILDDLTTFLDVRDFSREQHRTVYLAVLAGHRRRGEALLGDVAARLEERAALSSPGGWWAYLAGLAAEAPPALIVKQLAVHLAELGLQRLVMEGPRRVAGGQADAAGASQALADFNRRVQDKQQRIVVAQGGVVEKFDPLASAGGEG